ncbi:MAG: 16S rRNA (cytosine(1402)-N(4))-methyltransferase [Lentisphaerae bacterium GWF2_45_14]|nr:MAG: 16S rRNA (cytosine(1402)-N(4))-methyltransferase [Lentisphaerae bacterium GWF2_45_14]
MSEEKFSHIPVLREEAVNLLMPRDGPCRLIDATLGYGGHSSLILERNKAAEVLGIDRDGDAIDGARENLRFAASRVHLARGSFSGLRGFMAESGWAYADGVLFDFGISSPQVDNPERGFSLRLDGPLDMRMDKRSPGTAGRFLNTADQGELERIFREYGEIRKARALARGIVERRKKRPFTRTLELVELCEELLGKSIPGRMPSSTLCFQALRIAVNDELREIETALDEAFLALRPGGRMVAISFHSLEDRMVKNFFRVKASECVCPPGFPICVCGKKSEIRILTKKPIVAGREELEKNRRASCAKLRAAEKI